MGELLSIELGYTLLAVLVFMPALLGPVATTPGESRIMKPIFTRRADHGR